MQKDEGQSEVSQQGNESDKTTEFRSPPYVFTSAEPVAEENTMFSEKLRTTKALVIIGIVAVLIVAIITTGVLLGIFLYTDAQLEILKFTKVRSENQYQDVVDDPNTNVVQYHVRDGDQDAWVVNDFNRDIQTMKVQTMVRTNCYVTALNHSLALRPSEIEGPESYNANQTVSLEYRKTNTPVADTSFLHETAQKLCKGVSVYWLYPRCHGTSVYQQGTGQSHMSRRQADDEDKFTYIDKFATYVRACFICLCC